jgi:signal transduction histidine kinase
MISGSVDSARKLAEGVYPIDLDVAGLHMALEGVATRAERLSGISCNVCPEILPGTTLKGAGAAQLYHIAREALDNAIKHARAKQIDIYLNVRESGVELSVRDDGVGFPPDAAGVHGMGLHMMRYRAKTIGGTLHFGNAPSGGATVTVTCSISPGGELTL